MKNPPQQSQQQDKIKEKTGSEKDAIDRTFFLLEPEALMMFFVAGILDLIGYIIILTGLDDFGITDIIGSFFIGLWMLFRGSSPAGTRKGSQLKRWGLTSVVEATPYLGSLAPGWILTVYFELKNNPG